LVFRAPLVPAEAAAGAVQRVAGMTVAPPAQWRLVVGEVPGASGKEPAEVAVHAAEHEVKSETAERMNAMVLENMKHTPGVSTGPVPDGDRVPAGACPACGRPFLPGMKFCGVCGAKLPGGQGTGQAHPGNTCPAFGKEFSPGKTFCGGCGAKLPSPVHESATRDQNTCPACGSETGPGKKFCGACGHVLDER
jgi:predicted amidophosphoribosyltransferase